uniref:Putative secreted protein n=1 Tax=Ixodes ricinus TaxID=34613 RepID=V5H9N3_IXORI
MKLLLIAVVFYIYTSGLLTTAEAKCEPRYNGGYGLSGGSSVIPKWTFNPPTNHCEQVMTKGPCHTSKNCFQTEYECQDYCDPEIQRWKQELGQV